MIPVEVIRGLQLVYAKHKKVWSWQSGLAKTFMNKSLIPRKHERRGIVQRRYVTDEPGNSIASRNFDQIPSKNAEGTTAFSSRFPPHVPVKVGALLLRVPIVMPETRNQHSPPT
jgi:hypothetical protein